MNKNINIEQVVETARKAMDDKKAENIKVIYIGEISSVTDYFVICSASNPSQLEAIVDNVSEELGKLSVYSKKQEGNRNSGWIPKSHLQLWKHDSIGFRLEHFKESAY